MKRQNVDRTKATSLFYSKQVTQIKDYNPKAFLTAGYELQIAFIYPKAIAISS
jgi:hypothetical protein